MGCNSSTTINKELLNEKLILGYWAAPLQAQPARYILELASIPYEEELYTEESALDWFVVKKHNLGLDYPNLPYLIHEKFKLTESQNIVNYLVDITWQKSLEGEGQQKYKVDNIRFVCAELISKIYSASFKSGDEKKSFVEQNIHPKVKQLHTVLGKNTQFFDKLTLADIYAYIVASNLKRGLPDTYKEFEDTFDPFITKFESIPQIKTYHESDRYSKIKK